MDSQTNPYLNALRTAAEAFNEALVEFENEAIKNMRPFNFRNLSKGNHVILRYDDSPEHDELGIVINIDQNTHEISVADECSLGMATNVRYFGADGKRLNRPGTNLRIIGILPEWFVELAQIEI